MASIQMAIWATVHYAVLVVTRAHTSMLHIACSVAHRFCTLVAMCMHSSSGRTQMQHAMPCHARLRHIIMTVLRGVRCMRVGVVRLSRLQPLDVLCQTHHQVVVDVDTLVSKCGFVLVSVLWSRTCTYVGAIVSSRTLSALACS